MCEQTEINYLDGEVVWVKLGACWWPGQVTSFPNLPEDIQAEFRKKPLIAAVKFFQEDTYEFVKNLHQIYKYNCTQKDEFIKKGLDKYRTKSKDGSNYMDKFPGDVEMAEKLTGGDPDILTSDKFGPEQKPDISALFGEKKIPKRKRDRDEMNRRSEGGGIARKITHPRFLKESDHEIRIRQQPSSLPSTPKSPSSSSPQFSCHLCSFTSSRVNVIICHTKSHRSGSIESPISRPRIISHTQPKSATRPVASDTQKRKYVRKTKSLSSKSSNKVERETEPVKRKSTKQIEKTTKKKKTDPELREKLLADWDDESDEDMDLDLNKSADGNSIGSPSGKNSEGANDSSISGALEDNNPAEGDDGTEIIKASEKLLRDTEKFTTLLGDDSTSRTSRNSNNKNLDDFDSETDTSTSGTVKSEKSPASKKLKTKTLSGQQRLSSAASEKEVKDSSKFSCFDFDEEDLPEPNITPVRKIPRVFGEKNTSVKKEILKKFTMSQALKNEKDNDEDDEKAPSGQDFFPVKEKEVADKKKDNNEIAESPRSEVDDSSESKAAAKVEDTEVEEKAAKADSLQGSDEPENSLKTESSPTEQLEIVEIFEVEGEKDVNLDVSHEFTEKPKLDEAQSESVDISPSKSVDEKIEKEEENQIMEIEETEEPKQDSVIEKKEETSGDKNIDEATMSEVATTETEDETVSELAESIQGHSEASDTDGTLTQSSWDAASFAKVASPSKRSESASAEKPPPRRRGRPRKSFVAAVDASGNGNDSLKHEVASKKIEALVSRDSAERKTSESDSDRSYTGRRRKPNKRYLHSEVLTRSPDNRASRTDESQSETEEKLQKEQHKGKTRRGRKSSGVAAGTRVKTPQHTNKEDQEFEFSNRTLDSAELVQEETEKFPKSSPKTEKFEGKIDIKSTTTSQDIPRSDGIETEGDSSVSCPVDFGKKQSSSDISSPVNITKLLSSGDDEKSASQSSEKLQNVAETLVSHRVESTELFSDEAKSNSKFDAVKTTVDKLPPKKSQIKKFELSQIDLLDACSEQVAAESEAARLLSLAADPDVEGSSGPSVEVPYASPTPMEKVVVVQEVPIVAEKEEDSTSLIKTTSDEQEAIEQVLKNSTEIETEEVVVAEPAKIIINEEDAIDNQRDENKSDEPMNISSEMQSDVDETLATTNDVEKIVDDAASEIPKKDIIETAVVHMETPKQQSPVQSPRKVKKSTPETISKVSKEKKHEGEEEEVPVNSFQEAFLKTLHIDKGDKKDNEGQVTTLVAEKAATVSEETAAAAESTLHLAAVYVERNDNENSPMISQPQDTQQEKQQPVPTLNAMTEFEGIEILVQENIVEVDSKLTEGIATSQVDLVSGLVGTETKDEGTDTLSLDLQKIEDTLTDAVSTPSPSSSEISVPVKKREKPRIIENVTLKEPMQILKSKLLEKLPSKSAKHKLESDAHKRGEGKGAPRAKIMKIDSPSPNNKARTVTKASTSQLSLAKKLQALKAEETAIGNIAADKDNIEKAAASQVQATQTQTQISVPAGGEKFIQQSSQSLADMELDINSMPFVLSEDVLTPESIEQMPVVISTIIPASSASTSCASPASSSSSGAIPSSLTLTPTTKLVTSNQVQYKTTSETVTTESIPSPTTIVGKKKSGTPAILKTKGKAKPTITSIKTLIPPLTGGVKGLKFQSPQGGKTMPLISQKSTPGKYVIVQTASGQRYSVQGKPGVQQKIAIPGGKGAGSAQIVQQGGKVVILTSAQSGQTKMLPLNISKSLSGKVQKIVNNKGQIYTSMSGGQGMVGTKTMIAPKSDASSPTTSKLPQGQKILNTQGIITSKGVLTPISTSKGSLLSSLPQSMLTKSGMYTPISSAQLSGKAQLMSGKTLVNKTATILSPMGTQTLATSKTILAPISHSLTTKTIINTQGLMTSKGTVLTPITGQQVKAIAAKSPAKGGTKVHYQAVPQKLQLPMTQKCQKIPISPNSPMRLGSANVKSPSAGGGMILFAGTAMSDRKVSGGITPGGKKIVRQIVHSAARSPQSAAIQHSQTSVGTSPQLVMQRGKSLTTSTTASTGSAMTPTMQRVATPRNTGRQTKAQQKIVVQKLQDVNAAASISSPTINLHTKAAQTSAAPKSMTTTPQKSPAAHRVLSKANRNAQQLQQQHQKHMLNVALSSIAMMPAASNVESPNQQISPPPLAPLAQQPAEQQLGVSLAEVGGNAKMENTTLVVETLAKENVKHETPSAAEAALSSSTETPKIEETKVTAQPQIMALTTESSDGTQTYLFATIDEQGQLQILDNNALMTLPGTTQDPDGTRTLYIDPSSLGEAGGMDNIVFHIDNGALPNLPAAASGESSSQAIASTAETFATSEIMQTSNQDILAAALANTDFQQEIGLPDNSGSSSVVMSAGLTQTSLINQTILQSTIIPPTEPISSPSVLETSLTLNQPIMTPLEVPSSLPIQVKSTPSSVVSTIPTSLELPITITDPNISYMTAAAAAAAGTATSIHEEQQHIQMPGHSMPDIGEIMESPATCEIAQSDIPASTQYLVIPNLTENMTIQAQAVESDSVTGAVSYSVSIPDSAVGDATQVVQTTPSMPIIDDGFVETAEQSFVGSIEIQTDVSAAVEQTCEQPSASSASDDSAKPTLESQSGVVEASATEALPIVGGSEEIQEINIPIAVEEEQEMQQQQQERAIITSEEQQVPETPSASIEMVVEESCSTEVMTTSASSVTDDVTSEANILQQSEQETTTVSNSAAKSVEIKQASTLNVSEAADKQELDSLTSTNVSGHEMPASFMEQEPAAETSSLDTSTSQNSNDKVPFAEPVNNTEPESMLVEESSVEIGIYPGENHPDGNQSSSPRPDTVEPAPAVSDNNAEMRMEEEEVIAETSQEEAPSQSYEQQFNASGVTSDSAEEIPTQSAGKSENSREPSQSIAYVAMEIDENVVSGEPPTQSFEDSKSSNEASQSYETSADVNTNAPTQSFNEIMQCQDDGIPGAAEGIDDPSFPTQSYEVGKMDTLSENLESDAAVSQEGNIPSQSNDIGNDGIIGTSSVSTNNSGLNEDETASSSYVPETPENQERDQDQESAISTSSYEIPPCEELNIASSSVIPDTSVRGEHTSIHDNGVPEIPTSSYSLNPDSSSTSQVDALPTSSQYEDQVIVEQNVSTSYEVPISMPGLEENSSQNFVTESTDHRNEPSSYYARHQEVSASYYEAVNQDSNSRLEADPQEEVTPSFYETPQDITSEASQSYFRSTPRYSSQSVSPSYYDPAPESEASQSYYSHEIVEGTEQSSRNVEASQSFYQETSDEMRLRQQGEATPTYTERYPTDYALANSPIERHDLVESSVPATRPTER